MYIKLEELTSDQLTDLREELVQERIQTAGHGRRARIQLQIDAIDAEFDDRANQRVKSQ